MAVTSHVVVWSGAGSRLSGFSRAARHAFYGGVSVGRHFAEHRGILEFGVVACSTWLFVQLPAHVGPANPTATAQMGSCIPVLSVSASILGSGLWLTVADRDVALTAPGASRVGTYPVVVYGESGMAARVAKDCATWMDVLEWKFDGCCGSAGAAANLRDIAKLRARRCVQFARLRHVSPPSLDRSPVFVGVAVA